MSPRPRAGNLAPWAALTGAVLGAILAACAGQAAPSSSFADMDRRKDDIRDLDNQIRGWRVEMRLPTEPPQSLIAQVSPRTAISRCDKQPEGETCDDTCNLSDAICSNAESICRIADELGDDAWAAGKCKSAKASCREAAKKCCECVDPEPPADDMDAR